MNIPTGDQITQVFNSARDAAVAVSVMLGALGWGRLNRHSAAIGQLQVASPPPVPTDTPAQAELKRLGYTIGPDGTPIPPQNPTAV